MRAPDDAVLDSLVAAAAAGAGGAGPGGGWAFTIAHHRAADRFRQKARRPEPMPYEPERDERTAASAEAEALRAMGPARVVGMLSGLGADQREALLLRFVGELELEEVAVVMGRSPAAVKQLQRRGLAALRRTAVSAAGRVPERPSSATATARSGSTGETSWTRSSPVTLVPWTATPSSPTRSAPWRAWRPRQRRGPAPPSRPSWPLPRVRPGSTRGRPGRLRGSGRPGRAGAGCSAAA